MSKNVINFNESDEFLKIQNEWKFSEEELENFFEDLNYDGIYYEDTQHIKTWHKGKKVDIKKSFNLIISLKFITNFKEVKEKNNMQIYDFDSYNKLISKQNETLNKIQKYVERFVNAERLKIEDFFITKIPFYDNKKNILEVYYKFVRKIISDELYKANVEFNKKSNPLKELYGNIIKRLVDSGIKKEHAEKLLDFEPDYYEKEQFAIGFNTNYEVKMIGYYNNDSEQFYYDEEIFEEAIQDYKDGYCNDFL